MTYPSGTQVTHDPHIRLFVSENISDLGNPQTIGIIVNFCPQEYTRIIKFGYIEFIWVNTNIGVPSLYWFIS